MNKDRGNLKWTAMMLPEHIQRLYEWEKELAYTAPKEKTEWELEDLQQTIEQAYKQGLAITFSIFKQGTWSMEFGIITALEIAKKQLLVETETAVKKLDFATIQAVQVVDNYD
ncbi:YolD-like family protein [Solibacillus sp. FSL K6-1523]|uniref:YolD-like family protein n=1 Tax=Solibacillus sp. FSL K6-1523 TaxID=2921471 RepID=UPI0030F69D32